MTRRNWFALVSVAILLVGLVPAAASAQSGPVALQGKLDGVGDGERDFTLTIWDAATGGQAVATAQGTALVRSGLFTLLVDVPPAAFNGGPRWWSVMVEGAAASDRQRVSTVPVAHSVGGVLGVIWTPLGSDPSIVGGSNQRLTDGVSAAVIGGGRAHRVLDSYGATIGGGVQNTIEASRAFIGGGSVNTVTGNRGVLVGGDTNTLSGDFGFLGGGAANQLSGQYASLLGGRNNRAAGNYSVVLGGRDSGVFAEFGLAFGNLATVQHRGGMVFSASSERVATTGQNQFLIDAPGGVGIGTNAPQAALDVRGTTRTGVLRIVGGSDLAEPFPASPQQTIEPRAGLVLSIDPAHPGALRVATEAYDTRVAGVYSGGNGLNTGMLMGQDGCDLTADGDGRLPLAMTGRVWVYADDSNGPITPGDRLTTSGINAGYAARVADETRSIGAVIGKAMTAINPDTGMVLVLVNLQ